MISMANFWVFEMYPFSKTILRHYSVSVKKDALKGQLFQNISSWQHWHWCLEKDREGRCNKYNNMIRGNSHWANPFKYPYLVKYLRTSIFCKDEEKIGYQALMSENVEYILPKVASSHLEIRIRYTTTVQCEQGHHLRSSRFFGRPSLEGQKPSSPMRI